MHIWKKALDFYFLLHPLPPHHLSPNDTGEHGRHASVVIVAIAR
jgi:hypothetical protein